jgi:outer membrane protein, adhesin transport system
LSESETLVSRPMPTISANIPGRVYAVWVLVKSMKTLKPQLWAMCLLLSCFGIKQVIAQPLAGSAVAQSQSGFVAALAAVAANNPSILGKLAELEAQGYVIETNRASRYPSFSVSANNTNEEYGDQGTASISQPLYAFGKINTSIDAAKAQYGAEQWDLLRVQRELLEQAAVAYVGIDGIRQRLDVADLNISEHDILFQRIERREEGQLASEADVLLANSRLIQAQAQKQRIQGEFQVAVAELRALTLADVNTEQPVDPGMLNNQSEFSLQERALNNSAEIAYQRSQLEVAELNVKSQRISSLPTLYARAEHDFLDQRINQDTTRLGLVLEADLDGFGFATRGRIRSAASRLQAAEQQISVTTQEIRRQVSVLVANRDTQAQLIVAQKETVAAVEATLESFIRQYETGRKSWVEVLNTQRDLTNLRFDLVQYETDLMTLSMRIHALIGNLDELAGIESP